jgi:hypothetical protein
MWALAVQWFGPIVALAALIGLFVRGHRRESAVLPFWLGTRVIVPVFIYLRPDLYTWSVWIAKELLYDVLDVLLGVELAARLYSHLAWVAPRAQRFVVLVLLGTVVLVAFSPGPVVTTLLPRLTLALAALYLGLFALAVRFMLPLARLHLTILRGFTPCLLLFAVSWNRPLDDTTWVAWVNSLAFALLGLALLRAAWRRPEAPDAPADIVEWLWPWRSSR